MRFAFVVRFKEPGSNGTKAFTTMAKSPKAAAKKLKKRGRVTSVRRA